MRSFAFLTILLVCILAIGAWAGDSPINGNDGTVCLKKNME